ncbi:MAG: hypothetical protein IPJ19_02650 [Planctomycetes bacterium]|nr:hypothetical protein [Planctomycetota bacterium]
MLLRISALLCLTALASVAQPGGVEIGETVQYKFRESPLGSGGLKSMDELHGTPVLVEFWGTH